MKRISGYKDARDNHESKARQQQKYNICVEKHIDENAKQNFNRKPFYLTNTATMPFKDA